MFPAVVELPIDTDTILRQRAFEFLTELTDRYGDLLPRSALSKGFLLNDVRVPLIAPQGIFKPKVMDLPLSITTSPNSPYSDSLPTGGLLEYCYRGTDPNHRDNAGLRETMRLGRPLVYLHGATPGNYVSAWPVYVVGDDPENLTFTVAVDDKQDLSFSFEDEVSSQAVELR